MIAGNEKKCRVIGNCGKQYSVSPDSNIKKGASLLAPFFD